MPDITWIVPVTWQMTGVLEVEAKTKAEAIEKAHAMNGLPIEQQYVETSFDVEEHNITHA